MGLRKFIRKTVLQGRAGDAARPDDMQISMLEANKAHDEPEMGLLPKLLEDDIFGTGDRSDVHSGASHSSGSKLDRGTRYTEAKELAALRHFPPGLAPAVLEEAQPWSSSSEPEVEAEPTLVQSAINPVGLAVTRGGTFEMKDINLCSQKSASLEDATSWHSGGQVGSAAEEPAGRGFCAEAPAFIPMPSKAGGRDRGLSTASTRASLGSVTGPDEGLSALELEAVATQMDMQAAQLLAAAERVERAAAYARAQAAGNATQADLYMHMDDAWALDPSLCGYEASYPGMYAEANGGYYPYDWMYEQQYGGMLEQQSQCMLQPSGVAQPHQQRKRKNKQAAATRTSTSAPAKGEVVLVADEDRTTIMLRNIPNNYTRQMLQELLDSKGFAAKYDFIYLPMDFRSAAGLGYAFVNLTTHTDAEEAFAKFQGFSDWKAVSQKVCEVAWGQPLQGFEAHVERYRNSPVMHKDVQDEFRPAIFQDGVQLPFPEPTKAVHAPRNKRGKPDGGNSGAANPEGVAPES
mmetsp:Transcript_2882/g.4709  ORF Transcript_2882/g.4709 Transcript_2882/m.4709 type:complete len:519 (-) Transcript_2882:138-1694(-)